jgi:rfaE bifunctional protein kinase chain/domain
MFAGLRVLVAGDLIADLWIHATPQRVSREAPVLVFRHENERLDPGGAANVARNLAALGAKVEVFGAVGRDASGRELLARLEAEEIGIDGVERITGTITPTKTRVYAAEARRSPQQVLRLDREPLEASKPGSFAASRRLLARALQSADALLISDYGYGYASRELAELARAAADAGVPVVLDPRREAQHFAGLTAWTPNVGELAQLTQRDPDWLADERELCLAAQELQSRMLLKHLLVTRGNQGMSLFGAQSLSIPASGGGEVTDVTGAGDTSAAVFTLALAAGRDASAAMVLANAAAGVVVQERGAAVCTPRALKKALLEAPGRELLRQRRGGAR